MINPAEYKVALLCGGNSNEREISLASGEGAREALQEAGFNVVVLDPANKDDLKTLIDKTFDVAFLCMHGKGGEDGTLQGMLEILKIPYTCSHSLASAIAMDKGTAKLFYHQHGIPTPVSLSVTKGAEFDPVAAVKLVGPRSVVKPASEGSALGIYMTDTPESIEAAVAKVHEIDGKAIVETFAKGIELTVAVLGNDNPRALPVIEIVPRGEFYDFDSKYAPGGSQHIIPARISHEATEMVQDLAVRAHQALGCSGVSRTDVIYNEENGEAWVLETNTIPGMTATSLLPDAARAAGLTFPELCTQLIEFALAK